MSKGARKLRRKRKVSNQYQKDVLQKLQWVRKDRAPFEALSRQITRELLATHSFPDEGALVEIGSGDGQFLTWLPETIGGRVVHTDPSVKGVAALLARYPGAQVQQASAEHLPYGDGAVAGLLGLCVLDVVNDGVKAVREFARVLSSGGRVVHLLDMTTDLTAPISDLRRGELATLPNVVSDPCESEWPEDLFVAPLRDMGSVVESVLASESALAAAFAKYMAPFMRTPFSVARAVDVFEGVNRSASARTGLHDALALAMRQASGAERATLGQLRGHPLSSARHFEARLKQWFGQSDLFEIEYSGIVSASELCPKESTSGKRYLSAAVGHFRALDELPSSLLTKEPPIPHQDETLLEQSMFAFVARRK